MACGVATYAVIKDSGYGLLCPRKYKKSSETCTQAFRRPLLSQKRSVGKAHATAVCFSTCNEGFSERTAHQLNKNSPMPSFPRRRESIFESRQPFCKHLISDLQRSVGFARG